MSTALVKLLDAALLPALLTTTSKLLGLFIVVQLLNIPWKVNELVGTGVSQLSVPPERLVEISTFADSFMFTVIAGFTLFSLYRQIRFSSHKLSPSRIANLMQRGLHNLLSAPFEIFYSGSIAVLFCWVAAGVIIFDVAAGKTRFELSLIAIIVCLIYSTFLLRAVREQMQNSMRQL